jgi:hypothetical protein
MANGSLFYDTGLDLPAQPTYSYLYGIDLSTDHIDRSEYNLSCGARRNNASARDTLSNALEQYKGDAAFQRQEAQGGRA